VSLESSPSESTSGIVAVEDCKLMTWTRIPPCVVAMAVVNRQSKPPWRKNSRSLVQTAAPMGRFCSKYSLMCLPSDWYNGSSKCFGVMERLGRDGCAVPTAPGRLGHGSFGGNRERRTRIYTFYRQVRGQERSISGSRYKIWSIAVR
jgi:hypothetical protein